MNDLWRYNKFGLIFALVAVAGFVVTALGRPDTWTAIFGAIWVVFTIFYMYNAATWRRLYEDSEERHEQRRKAFWS